MKVQENFEHHWNQLEKRCRLQEFIVFHQGEDIMREKSYQLFQDFLLSNNNDEEVELYHCILPEPKLIMDNSIVKYKLTIEF